jgi:hypothetical protein
MADPAEVETQNILPVQALFNVDNSFNTFIGQGQPFIVSATDSIGIQDVTTLNATLYPTLSPVSTGQVTLLDVTSTKLSFNPSTGTLTASVFQGVLNGTASATTNIANGLAGNILYQAAPGVTNFVTNGSAGQVLTSNASSAPTWSNPTAYATVTDDTTTNATRYPLFADATAGNLTTEFVSSTKYQFNPSTGVLTATGFSGSGAALTSIPNGALVNSSVTIGSTAVALGATVATFAGLTSVTSTAFVGALTGNASTATTATTATNATNVAITDDTTTVSTVYPTFVTNTTGNLPVKTSSTKLGFVPSTGTLTLAAVQATNSAGLALKNSAGTTQMSMGAGGGDNMSINVSTNLNGTNAQIDISPTGTGHVHIKPTGVNSVEIAPTFVGEIDNVTIGATTPAAGTFTTLTAQNEVLKGTGNNFFTTTTTFSNFGTTSGTITLSTATTDPFGGTSVYKLVANSGLDPNAASNAILSGSGQVLPLGVLFTQSIYFKAAEFNALRIRNNNSGEIYTFTIGTTPTATAGVQTPALTLISNGWYRASWTFVTGQIGSLGRADNWSFRLASTGDGTSGIYVSSPQLEYGSTLGTYVPNTTTSALYGTPTLSFSGVASIGLQSDGSLYETSAGTGNIRFYTNNIGQEQARIAHTASAVNYVQVTGGATGSGPTISAQGSDAVINLSLAAKGGGSSVLFQANGLNAFQVSGTGTVVNRLRASGAIAGASPVFDVVGSDGNIDLTLTPKGTGNVRFGTFTSSVLTPTGYVEIKDSGGTVRRLLVG